MLNEHSPMIVGLPLAGEWLTPNTPGSKVPSHGTNRFGTRYAYDFVQVDWNRKGFPAYRVSFLQYLFLGVAIHNYYCWGQDIYAPFDGIVVQAVDGYQERSRTNVFLDARNAYKNAHHFQPDKDNVQVIAGNYVIIKHSDGIYAGLCHLQTNSIKVRVGQAIKKGDVIGKVGHSGNSFAPHLHFQLMDHEDFRIAQGIPCAFESYEVFENGVWITKHNSLPTSKERIRFIR